MGDAARAHAKVERSRNSNKYTWSVNIVEIEVKFSISCMFRFKPQEPSFSSFFSVVDHQVYPCSGSPCMKKKKKRIQTDKSKT